MWVDIFYKKYRSTFLKRVLFKKHGPGSNGSRQVLQKPTSTAIGESNLGNSQIRNSKFQFVEKTSVSGLRKVVVCCEGEDGYKGASKRLLQAVANLMVFCISVYDR